MQTTVYRLLWLVFITYLAVSHLNIIIQFCTLHAFKMINTVKNANLKNKSGNYKRHIILPPRQKFNWSKLLNLNAPKRVLVLVWGGGRYTVLAACLRGWEVQSLSCCPFLFFQPPDSPLIIAPRVTSNSQARRKRRQQNSDFLWTR
jgi:hypothetical protein